ncbi:MAG: type I-B CRISPR-associated endonuclease Cas1b [Thermoplasmata archaeon]
MGDVFYLIKSGILSKESNSLILKNETEKIEIPIETVDSLMIFGNVTFTTPAIKLLSEFKIPTILFTENGWYISSLMPENYLQSGIVLERQVSFRNDPEKRQKIAKKFVYGAAKNMRKVIQRLGIKQTLQIPIKEIDYSTTIAELMGIEGNIHIKYIQLLDTKLPELFKINNRSRQPPLNFTNSLMSYLYTVLYGVISAEIFSTHLSQSISYLHELSERRSSLSLDVAEIFRPIFCDRVILKLINLKIITSKDFVDNNGIFLNNEGKRKVLNEFDSKMRETIFVRSLGRYVSNRHLIRLELYKLEKYILGGEEYNPYIVRI